MTLNVCPVAERQADEIDAIRLALAQERLHRAVMMRWEFDPKSLPSGLRALASMVAEADPGKSYLSPLRLSVLSSVAAESAAEGEE